MSHVSRTELCVTHCTVVCCVHVDALDTHQSVTQSCRDEIVVWGLKMRNCKKQTANRLRRDRCCEDSRVKPSDRTWNTSGYEAMREWRERQTACLRLALRLLERHVCTISRLCYLHTHTHVLFVCLVCHPGTCLRTQWLNMASCWGHEPSGSMNFVWQRQNTGKVEERMKRLKVSSLLYIVDIKTFSTVNHVQISRLNETTVSLRFKREVCWNPHSLWGCGRQGSVWDRVDSQIRHDTRGLDVLI